MKKTNGKTSAKNVKNSGSNNTKSTKSAKNCGGKCSNKSEE